MAEERPEFASMQRISVVQFLCDRERGTIERRVRQELIQVERHSKEPGLYTVYSDVIMNVLGPAGSGRCFELLMIRNWYSLCGMLLTYPYYNFLDLKFDWSILCINELSNTGEKKCFAGQRKHSSATNTTTLRTNDVQVSGTQVKRRGQPLARRPCSRGSSAVEVEGVPEGVSRLHVDRAHEGPLRSRWRESAQAAWSRRMGKRRRWKKKGFVWSGDPSCYNAT
ncbi:hypothetical protein DMN91_012734 [Ooceraea biroi]|uniref:Uncharacterized protein n=1 Tax=Ooceraea biroi TaxID=2015173 RepID=A0A3L8D2W8_OOCBI|nr:hypothetical protein DMN91_012734 [Ooceraea biroi]